MPGILGNDEDSEDELDTPHQLILNNTNCYIEESKLNEFFEFDKINKKKCYDINLMHINCRSIRKNFFAMRNLLNNTSDYLSAIAVTETWLNPFMSDVYMLPGYNFVSNSRTVKSGGGVGFFVKSSITYSIRPDLARMCPYIECMFIELEQTTDKNIIFGCVYRPPSSDVTLFNSELDCLLDKAVVKQNQLIFIAGDFNLDLLSCTSSNLPVSAFVNIMSSHYLFPCIHNPTRVTDVTSTLLDNIFTNTVKHEIRSAIIYSDISDHYPVAIHVSRQTLNNKAKYSKKPVNSRLYPITAINAFNSELASMSWESTYEIVLKDNDPNRAYNCFFNLYKDAFDKHFPLAPRKSSKKLTPRSEWITKALMKSCSTKARLYKKYCLNRSTSNKEIFIKYRNRLNTLLRKTERDYYSSKFKSAMGNMKDTWKLINSALKSNSKPTLSEHFLVNGIRIVDKQEIVRSFNNYFGNIGPHLASLIPKADKDFTEYLTDDKMKSFSLFPTDPLEIVRIASGMNNKLSFGCDEIPVSIMKSSIASIATPLSFLINSSFCTGIFPHALKIGKLCPVFKAGDKTLLSNYRPISILPSFSKLYEKCIHNRLTSYLEANQILTTCQYGFRKNHSTHMAITDLYDNISMAIDNNEFVLSVFVDLAKAFDTIDYDILYTKLSYYGIRGITLELFKSYLTSRKQYVYSSGVSSDLLNVTHGVPQGSILGPLLFIIYINDIVKCSSVLRLLLFADDTTLLNSNKDFNKLINCTNTELTLIADWFKANKLSINVDKTCYVLFGTKRMPESANFNVILNGKQLNRVKYTKFLGLLIDDKLCWNEHLNYIGNKVSRGLGIIGRLKCLFPPHILMSLYYSLIYPYLCYCCIVWGNAYPTALHHIEVLQNRATRLLTNSHYRASAEPLYKQLNLLQLRDLYTYQVLIFMFQAYHNSLPQSCRRYFVHNIISHGTRRASYFKLFSCHTNIRKKGICITGPILWNTLSVELQDSNNIFTFKKKVKNLLIVKYS
jgi:hypothetical protein